MTSAQLNKLLKAHGWVQRNQAGSHITFKKEGVRT
ncbi:type II toxin-antitoxin system HicA family toxin [Sutterella wadsworthensis]|nr:type II toxin-antitoxin system HicA family toxin [Sutterella wadsworthensis]